MGLAMLNMPQLGESVTEGTVDRWLKKEGEMVLRDEPIVEVVTDKVNAEIPSPFEGRLVRICVAAGETVTIGSPLAEFEVEGAVVTPAPADPKEVASRESPPVPIPVLPPMRGQTLRPSTSVDGAKISPVVRRLIDENGLDLSEITGTGDGGRVTRADVTSYLSARESAATATADAKSGGASGYIGAAATSSSVREELVRISAIRRTIAEHMIRSLSTSPHAWALREVDVTRLIEYREAHQAEFQARHGFPLSYVPFFVQIVSEALMKNPYLNSTWTEEGILLKHYVNMGIAVALPDGVIVPVIKDADQKGFTDIAHALNDLATRARSKSLRPEDVQGGTFTLNNTGALGSVAGQAIINQPQAAILCTEGIRKRPTVVNDSIVIRPIMNLTMSFDHRIVDGLAASQFLNAVQNGIEEWTPTNIKI